MYGFFRRNQPNKVWLKEALKRNEYTPDVAELEQYRRCLLFEYNDPTVGLFVYDADTLDANTTLWEVGEERVMLETSLFRNNPTLRTFGSINAVTPQTIKLLDITHQNGVKFQRKRIRVRVPYLRTMTDDHVAIHSHPSYTLKKAWTYVGIPDYWQHKIDGGFTSRPADRVESNIGTHWVFKRR